MMELSLMLLRVVCMCGVLTLVPKRNRGLRCTEPFCDFSCVTDDAANMGDMGADIDIDDEVVRRARASFLHTNNINFM
jgi:hypothetical protein